MAERRLNYQTKHWRISPKFHRTAKLLAYRSLDEQTRRPKIIIVQLDGSTPEKMFDLPLSSNLIFHWSPDGRSLIFAQNVLRVSNLWRLPLDGGKPVQITDFKSDVIYNFVYSRDGHQLVLSRSASSSDAVLIADFK